MNDKLFIEYWIKKIQDSGIKKFPFDFIDQTHLDIFQIPIKFLVIGQEFFGGYEIITTEGESVYHALNYNEAKFFIYSSRQREGKAYLPKDKSLLKSVVDDYDKYLDGLIDQIKKDYKKYFQDVKNFHSVSNEIFKKLNLIRT